MTHTYKVMVIAGEASGDILAAGAMAELKASLDTPVEFIGVGGEQMAKQGLISAFPMKELSIMGIAEVLPHIPLILKRIKQMVELAKIEKPDLLLTIDSPDFCHRVAKRVKKETGIPCVHYVSPSIWAWRRNRVFKMAKYLDHVLALFPFEPEFYKPSALKCSFVGHPVVARLAPYKVKEKEDTLLLMPGSRTREITSLLPVFYKAALRLKEEGAIKQIKCALATDDDFTLAKEMAPSLQKEDCIIGDARYAAMAISKLAFAASGTANLELAVLNTPMVVAYTTGKLTAFIARKIIKVPFISPTNWVLGKKVIPELLQEEFTEEAMLTSARQALSKNAAQIEALKIIETSLTTQNPNAEVARILSSYLKA